MNELLQVLAQNAMLFLAGTTLLLSLGCGAVLLCKSPVHRQRISELTIAGVLGWMVLALFPLPRLLPDSFVSAGPRATVLANPAESDSLLVAEPTESYSGILPPTTEISIDGPLRVPEAKEVLDEAPVGNSVAPGGIGIPSYEWEPQLSEPSIPSPSEELPQAVAVLHPPEVIEEIPASTHSAPSLWQIDRTKFAGLIIGAYLAGASLCVLWIFSGHVILLRIRMTAEVPPHWLVQQYQSLTKQSGIAAPRLIVSRLCSRPLTWGVLWPVVVLPHSLCRQENKSQLETILLHELGHIAQQDAQGNLLFCAALPLLYAHPLYWWLRRESQLAAELVADDWAAWQTGKETYVEELVALARCTGTSSLPLVGVTGLFSSPSQFYRRMSMLLAREKPLSTRTSLPWRLASLSALVGAVALAASLAGVRPAAGQTDPTAPPATTPVPALTPPATPPVADIPMALPPSTATPGATTPVPAPPLPPPSLTPTGPTPPTLPNSFAPPSLTPQPAKTPITFTSEDEEAVLLREIANLQEKLNSFRRQREPATGAPANADNPGKPVIKSGKPVAKHLQVLRTDEKGIVWIETWTDEQGRPGKVLTKQPTVNWEPGVNVRATVKGGKTIMTEITNPDGSRVERILDSATGKVISENRIGYPKGNQPQVGDRTVERRFPTPIVSDDTVETTARTPVPSTTPQYYVPQSAGDPNQAKSAQQLDLVTLATSYSDAISAVEVAEARVGDNVKLAESKAISQQEATSAELALRAAKRKELLLRSIAEAATQSAAREVERTAQLHKSGHTISAAMGEAETRLVILKQILATRQAENTPSPSKP